MDVTSTQYVDPARLRFLLRAHERALAEGSAKGLAIPTVIVQPAPRIFWLSELARKLPQA